VGFDAGITSTGLIIAVTPMAGILTVRRQSGRLFLNIIRHNPTSPPFWFLNNGAKTHPSRANSSITAACWHVIIALWMTNLEHATVLVQFRSRWRLNNSEALSNTLVFIDDDWEKAKKGDALRLSISWLVEHGVAFVDRP
jgi:hypothetical protein